MGGYESRRKALNQLCRSEGGGGGGKPYIKRPIGLLSTAYCTVLSSFYRNSSEAGTVLRCLSDRNSKTTAAVEEKQ